MMRARPVIGVTLDNRDNHRSSGLYEVGVGFGQAIAAAGGMPVFLAHELSLVDACLDLCDGFVLSGGVDPVTEGFGFTTDPRARPMDAVRQAFELALLDRLAAAPLDAAPPTLGVCLGMQLMTLHGGGALQQFLPDTLVNPAVHAGGHGHTVTLTVDDGPLAASAPSQAARRQPVFSNHRQAVADPGSLRVAARAPDGVIEAVDDPGRPFWLGVQWHPERDVSSRPSSELGLGQGLFRELVAACRR